jgi:hypothetical protein
LSYWIVPDDIVPELDRSTLYAHSSIFFVNCSVSCIYFPQSFLSFVAGALVQSIYSHSGDDISTGCTGGLSVATESHGGTLIGSLLFPLSMSTGEVG